MTTHRSVPMSTAMFLAALAATVVSPTDALPHSSRLIRINKLSGNSGIGKKASPDRQLQAVVDRDEEFPGATLNDIEELFARNLMDLSMSMCMSMSMSMPVTMEALSMSMSMAFAFESQTGESETENAQDEVATRGVTSDLDALGIIESIQEDQVEYGIKEDTTSTTTADAILEPMEISCDGLTKSSIELAGIAGLAGENMVLHATNLESSLVDALYMRLAKCKAGEGEKSGSRMLQQQTQIAVEGVQVAETDLGCSAQAVGAESCRSFTIKLEAFADRTTDIQNEITREIIGIFNSGEFRTQIGEFGIVGISLVDESEADANDADDAKDTAMIMVIAASVVAALAMLTIFSVFRYRHRLNSSGGKMKDNDTDDEAGSVGSVGGDAGTRFGDAGPEHDDNGFVEIDITNDSKV